MDYTIYVHSPNFITYMTGSSPAREPVGGTRGEIPFPTSPAPIPSPSLLLSARLEKKNGVNLDILATW